MKRDSDMRKSYDFSKGRRGPVLPIPPGKTRITIRLDDDVLNWFRARVNEAGGGNYQTLINQALRKVVESPDESVESVARRVVREELARYSRLPATRLKKLKRGAKA